jgi:nucleoside 2-deoxyribosyltransferase
MSAPVQVYIAAPYPERAAAQRVGRALEAAGVAVTSSWLCLDDVPSEASAARDLADVARADVLVALNPDSWHDRGTGGRHVEVGYALALGKPIVLVGARSQIFHHLRAVTVVPDDRDLAAHVAQALARPRRGVTTAAALAAPDGLHALLVALVQRHLTPGTWQVVAIAPIAQWPRGLQKELRATLSAGPESVVLVLERVPS